MWIIFDYLTSKAESAESILFIITYKSLRLDVLVQRSLSWKQVSPLQPPFHHPHPHLVCQSFSSFFFALMIELCFLLKDETDLFIVKKAYVSFTVTWSSIQRIILKCSKEKLLICLMFLNSARSILDWGLPVVSSQLRISLTLACSPSNSPVTVPSLKMTSKNLF